MRPPRPPTLARSPAAVDPVAIEVAHLCKSFRVQRGHTTLKTALIARLRGRPEPERPPAREVLRDVSVTVRRGRTLGVIGRNGSGKSTLLRILAGILRADSGRVRVEGRTSALLDLGVGFHPEFSGRENVLISGVVLGLSRREIRRRLPDIVDFAELGPVIDDSVRTYSSGMAARLGFAVAVHTDPDVLLVDEILAVGDEAFARRCEDKLAELRGGGRTVVLVSHDLGAVERWSDEAIWLDQGRVAARGRPVEVVQAYLRSVEAGEGGALARSSPAS